MRRGEIDAGVYSSGLHEPAIAMQGTDQPYRKLVEAMSAAVVTISPDGVILHCNQRLAELLGVPPEKVIGSRLQQYLVAADATRLPEAARQSQTGVQRFRITLAAPDGRLIPALIAICGQRGEGREGISAVITDLSEVIAAREELARMVDAANDAIIGLDLNESITLWNKGAQKIFGYAAGEVMGRPASLLASPESKLELPMLIKQMHAGREISSYETVHVAKDGRLVPVTLTLSPVLGAAGRAEGISVIIRDITERKQMEDGLRAAARYTRSLIEACPDAMAAISAEGRLTDVNEATVRITGVPREKLVGTDFAAYFTEPEKARAAYQEVFSRGSVTGFPLAIRHAWGQITEVLCNANLYRNEKNEVEGAFAVARDVTQQKHHEVELNRLHAETTRTVTELKRREAEILEINELYDVLQTCDSLQEAYAIVASVGARLFPNASGALAVSVSRARAMETVAEWGSEPLMTATFALDDCWALRRGQEQDVRLPNSALACRHFKAPPRAPYICSPLTVRGELEGLLHLRSATDQPMSERQRHLLTTFGEVIKLSLSNLKLREVLRTQSIRDPLTGLSNRHYLDETLRRELCRAARRQTTLCLAMLDIDGFKGFNDSYGHDAGDAVLRALGKLFARQMRASDLACRYGGDEFILVLFDTRIEQVLTRVKQWCGEIKQMECIHEGVALPGTSVSVGLAQWPDHASSAEELVKAADRALYSAKSSGRDQVGVFGVKAPGSPQRVPPSAGPERADPAATAPNPASPAAGRPPVV